MIISVVCREEVEWCYECSPRGKSYILGLYSSPIRLVLRLGADDHQVFGHEGKPVADLGDDAVVVDDTLCRLITESCAVKASILPSSLSNHLRLAKSVITCAYMKHITQSISPYRMLAGLLGGMPLNSPRLPLGPRLATPSSIRHVLIATWHPVPLTPLARAVSPRVALYSWTCAVDARPPLSYQGRFYPVKVKKKKVRNRPIADDPKVYRSSRRVGGLINDIYYLRILHMDGIEVSKGWYRGFRKWAPLCLDEREVLFLALRKNRDSVT